MIKSFTHIFLLTILSKLGIAQTGTQIFKSDSAIYIYALQDFINVTGIKDSIWLERNDVSYQFLPKMIANTKIKLISPINYIEGVRRKKVRQLVIMSPIRFYNGYHRISVVLFELSFNKRKRNLHFVNSEGISLKLNFDCNQNGYVLLSDK